MDKPSVGPYTGLPYNNNRMAYNITQRHQQQPTKTSLCIITLKIRILRSKQKIVINKKSTRTGPGFVALEYAIAIPTQHTNRSL